MRGTVLHDSGEPLLPAFLHSYLSAEMLDKARAQFHAAVTSHTWVLTLAGFLPLSALIDFLDLRALHSFHLTGAVPHWCWPLTPGGSRLLLSERHSSDFCCLDEYGRSVGLSCLDGRWGDNYSAANPETLRMWLTSTEKPIPIDNRHANMADVRRREQKLEIVHVKRPLKPKKRRPLIILRLASWLGWIFLTGLFVLTILMECYWALVFLVLMPLTGVAINRMHVKGPRKLKIGEPGKYNRLVVVTEHMNETFWRVFYGDSDVVNALLNKPLRKDQPLNEVKAWPGKVKAWPGKVKAWPGKVKAWPGKVKAWYDKVATGAELSFFRLAFRAMVAGQWVLAIAAAALQGWDAFIIAFWIGLSILSRTFIFSEEQTVREWVHNDVGVEFERYRVTLSSRKTLLGLIVALNPDSFKLEGTKKTDYSSKQTDAWRWIDPILKVSDERDEWQEKLRSALKKEKISPDPEVSTDPSEDWRGGKWEVFIEESIEVFKELKREGCFISRKIEESTTDAGTP